jgi:heme/copper-type cytochrome/quinol oxidase subunit 3
MENENPKPMSAPDKAPKKIGVVETYAADMTKTIEKAEGGMIRKIIAENEEHEAVKKNISPESKRNKLFMFIGVILVFFAFFILVFLFIFKNQISTINVAPQGAPIIFTDQTQYKEVAGLTGDQMAQTILNETNATNVKSGGVEGLYLTENKKIIGLRGFLALLKANLDISQNAFVDDNFLLGIANENTTPVVGTGGNLFILLKTRSFDDIFPALKNWENKIFSDLHGLFGVDINADTNYLLTKNFEDGMVSNKNARILRDQDGKVVLEYIFADDTSIIITNSDIAAQEVMLRLASGQIRQ